MRSSHPSTTLKANPAIGAAAVLLAGAIAFGASGAQAQGIGGVTNCSAPGGKQEAGALMGAVVGGLIGNKVGGRHATGETVVGAAAGAAAGSAIGCQMQKSRANSGHSRTYTEGGYRLSSQIAPAKFSKIGDTFVSRRSVNLRAAPSTGSSRVGALRPGERFQALARVRGTEWILVGQGGVGVGYVHGGYVEPAGRRYAGY
jgi:hypothetical protein